METTTRRHFLRSMGGVALGAVALTGTMGLFSCTTKAKEEEEAAAFPWPYQELDPVAAAERAYEAYYKSGCMYGAFEGIIGELRAQVGGPYESFPSAMMAYGGAGVAGWGTLCGACNGAAAAIALVVDPKERNKVINEVFGWYGQTALPDYKPKTPKFDTIVTSVADSQLCHVSVTKWSDVSGFKTGSSERAERCAWVTASTVKYAVDLLNKQAAGSLVPAYAVPASVTGCLTCHGKGGMMENVHITNQTACTDCHSDISPTHPAK